MHAWSGIRGVISNGVGGILDSIRGIPDRLRGMAGSWGSAGRALIGAFVDGLKNAGGIVSGIAGNVWDAVRSMLNSAISRINSALSATIPIPGAPDIPVNPTNIPYLAGGTSFHRGGLAVVGERGPELVDLPRGSAVTPNSGSADLGRAVIVVRDESGKEMQRKLLKLKRTTADCPSGWPEPRPT